MRGSSRLDSSSIIGFDAPSKKTDTLNRPNSAGDKSSLVFHDPQPEPKSTVPSAPRERRRPYVKAAEDQFEKYESEIVEQTFKVKLPFIISIDNFQSLDKFQRNPSITKPTPREFKRYTGEKKAGSETLNPQKKEEPEAVIAESENKDSDVTLVNNESTLIPTSRVQQSCIFCLILAFT